MVLDTPELKADINNSNWNDSLELSQKSQVFDFLEMLSGFIMPDMWI